MKKYDWKEFERRKESLTKPFKKKIRELRESSGIDILQRKIWDIEKKIDKERLLALKAKNKEKISNGQIVTLVGGPFSWLGLFNHVKGKVIRKNKDTAKVKWYEGKIKGETWTVKYGFIEEIKQRCLNGKRNEKRK